MERGKGGMERDGERAAFEMEERGYGRVGEVAEARAHRSRLNTAREVKAEAAVSGGLEGMAA